MDGKEESRVKAQEIRRPNSLLHTTGMAVGNNLYGFYGHQPYLPYGQPPYAQAIGQPQPQAIGQPQAQGIGHQLQTAYNPATGMAVGNNLYGFYGHQPYLPYGQPPYVQVKAEPVTIISLDDDVVIISSDDDDNSIIKVKAEPGSYSDFVKVKAEPGRSADISISKNSQPVTIISLDDDVVIMENESAVESAVCIDSDDDEKVTPKWIDTGKTYTIPSEVWTKLFINRDIPTHLWTYYKNKIGDDFDTKWKCIVILDSRLVGKRIISMKGHCKHTGCRKFQFKFPLCQYVEGVSPAFKVRVSQTEIKHDVVLTRQLRGAQRDEYKDKLKTQKPSTLARQLVIDMDLDQYQEGNSSIVKSDEVLQKVRSEVVLSNDLAKADFDDLVALQKETASDPFIQKVISPFAVYMHSKIQNKVLEECHRRLPPGGEVVVYFDATGGVVKVSPETSTHPILYYPAILPLKPDPTDKKSLLFPVTESINSAHGAPDISSWLSDFNEGFTKECPTIKKAFHRMLSDFSYANFHGALHSFESMRIQQYLYVWYKYAVGLTDFDTLRNITKLEMCKAHLSKTFTSFIRKHFPSTNPSKKTCYEQKFIIEVLCSMMVARSYNVLKEIYHNLCVLILAKKETAAARLAKENLISLCTSNDVLDGNLRATYKFDNLLQSTMDEISECTTVYEYNESILKLPIYKSSCFYYDFKHIYDTVAAELETNDNCLPNNIFHNKKILEEFMVQFSGILPLWTAITIPKGLHRRQLPSDDVPDEGYDSDDGEIITEITKRGSNQTSESHMNIVKQLMHDNSLELGAGKIKVTRFIKLLRPIVLSHAKRFLIKLRRNRLNHGPKPKPPIDNSKVKKRIIRNIKAKATVRVLKNRKKGDEASIANAKESWAKRPINDRKKFSYFDKRTLLSQNQVKLVKPQRKTANKPQRKQGKKVTDSSFNTTNESYESNGTVSMNGTNESCATGSMNTTNESCDSIIQRVGTGSSIREASMNTITLKFNIPRHYIETKSSVEFVIAKIGRHNLLLSDYKSLLPNVHLSLQAMNYIFEFLLPSNYVNLTLHAQDIFAGIDNLKFTLVDCLCYMPIFIRNSWHLFFINTKKRTFTYYNPLGTEDVSFSFFFKFIEAYNDSSNHKTKLRRDDWRLIEFNSVNKTQSDTDSGIFVVKAAYQFVTEKNIYDQPFDCTQYRQVLVKEVSQFSDDISNLCSLCGELNDNTGSQTVDWTMCETCEKWFHDVCCKFINDRCTVCVAYQPIGSNNVALVGEDTDKHSAKEVGSDNVGNVKLRSSKRLAAFRN